MILLSYAAFANSIGAVVGRVTIRTGGSVTSRSEGHCRLHLSDRVLDFADEQEALLTLKGTLCQAVQFAAQSAGAEDVELDVSRDVPKTTVENRDIFVEAEVHVVATG